MWYFVIAFVIAFCMYAYGFDAGIDACVKSGDKKDSKVVKILNMFVLALLTIMGYAIGSMLYM